VVNGKENLPRKWLRWTEHGEIKDKTRWLRLNPWNCWFLINRKSLLICFLPLIFRITKIRELSKSYLYNPRCLPFCTVIFCKIILKSKLVSLILIQLGLKPRPRFIGNVFRLKVIPGLTKSFWHKKSSSFFLLKLKLNEYLFNLLAYFKTIFFLTHWLKL